MDKQAKKQRHRCMSVIKGKSAKPELLVLKFRFSRGVRYRLNHPRLLGHPDMVLRGQMIIVL
ncbi:MAG: very short patch repair endonuclease [Bacteroidaceae bacterium]|nr:very short patch repair endonuclease [Bacteroidaceae bacterium]